MAPTVRIIGAGRAGGALALALRRAGWTADLVGRGDHRAAAQGVDLLVIATGDAAVADVAADIDPVADTVVAHLAGSLGLDVLAPHSRRAALHPLMSLADTESGADALAARGWFAVAGDPLIADVVRALGGRSFTVADDDRALYHATAAVAANHVVALLGQVERLAERVGVPAEAFLAMSEQAVVNTARFGAAAALTGPAARGDHATIDRHRASLPNDEVELYEALLAAAQRLVR